MNVQGEDLIVAELKSAKGRCSIPQMEWLEVFEATGASVFVWRPAEWMSGHIERALRGDTPPPTNPPGRGLGVREE